MLFYPNQFVLHMSAARFACNAIMAAAPDLSHEHLCSEFPANGFSLYDSKKSMTRGHIYMCMYVYIFDKNIGHIMSISACRELG
jgi:hypothetical protein